MIRLSLYHITGHLPYLSKLPINSNTIFLSYLSGTASQISASNVLNEGKRETKTNGYNSNKNSLQSSFIFFKCWISWAANLLFDIKVLRREEEERGETLCVVVVIITLVNTNALIGPHRPTWTDIDQSQPPLYHLTTGYDGDNIDLDFVFGVVMGSYSLSHYRKLLKYYREY